MQIQLTSRVLLNMEQKTSFEIVRLDLADDIKNSYEIEDIKIVKTKFISDLYSVFVSFKKENEIDKNWDKLNSVISVELSLDFKSDFERWNLYFFYICKGKVRPYIKYKVENNKAFSRKILVDNFGLELKDETIDFLISKNIINSDLLLENNEKDTNVEKQYNSNSIVYNLIDSKDLNNNKNEENPEILYSELLGLLKNNFVNGRSNSEN